MTEDMDVHHRAVNDRGAILPFLALSLLAIMAVAALVLDGGAAYSQRRQMQNAADAASLAGTIALDDVRFEGATYTKVKDEVERVAAENDADELECELLTDAGAVIADCATATEAQVLSASQVRALATSTRETVFGGLVGIDTTTAPADATAALQRLVGYANAQFSVCSSGVNYDILDEDNNIVPEKAVALGKISLMGAQIYKDDEDCTTSGGPGSGSFKGEIDEELLVIGDEVTASSNPGNSLPGDWEDHLIACPGDASGEHCLLLPVTGRTVGSGTGASMQIVAWAYWRATDDTSGCYNPGSGSVKLCGSFVEPAGVGALPGAVFGGGEIDETDIRRAVLVE